MHESQCVNRPGTEFAFTVDGIKENWKSVTFFLVKSQKQQVVKEIHLTKIKPTNDKSIANIIPSR